MKVDVYILRLAGGKHYTGITKNLVERLKQHNSGQSKSTRKFLPAVLIWNLECNGYRQARRVEKRIKSMGAKKWLSLENSSDIFRKTRDQQQKNIAKRFLNAPLLN